MPAIAVESHPIAEHHLTSKYLMQCKLILKSLQNMEITS
jgi:hypothetical protein